MRSSVRLLSGPPAHAALLRGVDRMARLLRPTLGPLPRTVAIARLTSTSYGPEVLDSGGLTGPVSARRRVYAASTRRARGGSKR